jgi:hypothetical protein
VNLTLKDLFQAVFETVQDARRGARMIMAIQLERRQRWELLLLIAVLSAFMAGLSLLIGGGSGFIVGGPAMLDPLTLGVAQYFLLLSMVFGIHIVGTRFGGKGGLDEAILLVTWLQFVLICLQAVQIVAMVFLPPLAFLIGVAGIGLFFWLLTAFVAELHGFSSTVGVFVSILIVMVVFTTLFRFLLGVLGIAVLGAP